MNTRFMVAMAFAVLAFAGCLDSGPDDEIVGEPEPVTLDEVILVESLNAMNFTAHTVDAAVSFGNDLYEPTMEVSDTGAIYVTGHTILVDTTGAPVFVSLDDGDTWKQLPFAGTATMPEPTPGATPPPSDEIFIVAGNDGFAYGVDITLAAFPVNAWAGDGSEHVYHNPNAYDRAESTSSGTCSAASLNDRPWAAYGDGKLLMVNNPGGGPMQIGVLDVPVATPVGVGGPVVGPQWNTCASTGGYIPGIPDMRADNFFGVPQIENGRLHVVVGNASDIDAVTQVDVMSVDNSGGGTSNYGQVNFDADGTMFVAVRSNDDAELGEGRISVAVSQDDGATFALRHFDMPRATTSVYMDGNMAGAGALLTWAEEADSGTNWYAGHLFVGPDGAAILENVSIVLEEGPFPSAHVQGAAAGPDGRGYLVMDYGAAPTGTPLGIMRQLAGPTLPVTVQIAAE